MTARPLTVLIVIWALCLTTWVTLRVFGEAPPMIEMGTATAYATLFGLPALAVKLWQWTRGRS
jgi:hypothetical protein